MSKKEHMIEILQGMGYTPVIDDEGDLMMCYQMKNLFLNVDEDENYVCIVCSRFERINEGEEGVALATCNKVTRELRLCKAFVNSDFKFVSASCEFYYANDESLMYSLKKSLWMLGFIKREYQKYKKDMQA